MALCEPTDNDTPKCMMMIMHVLQELLEHLNIYISYISGRKGGAMGLQSHLILRVLHRILIFYHREIYSLQYIIPT